MRITCIAKEENLDSGGAYLLIDIDGKYIRRVVFAEVDSLYFNIQTPTYDQPKDMNRAFVLMEGLVNYIGNWSFRQYNGVDSVNREVSGMAIEQSESDQKSAVRHCGLNRVLLAHSPIHTCLDTKRLATTSKPLHLQTSNASLLTG